MAEGNMEKPNPKKDSVEFSRHSKATYQPFNEVVAGQTPMTKMDREKQVADLGPEGVQMAETAAREKLQEFDPKTDILFFASSDEMRALETAKIYRKIAKEMGFTVLRPENVRGELANKIGEGEVRTVKALSLNIKSPLLSTVFSPETHLPSLNWDAVDPETRSRIEPLWAKARSIIHAGDKGSWGANFFAHGETIKKLFADIYPGMRTPQELYEREFNNLAKLASFALEKAKTIPEKNVKVLAFGHENYMGYALEKYFQDHEIKNCESVTIETEGDGLAMTRRGQKKVIKE